jgi:hypothetical protein
MESLSKLFNGPPQGSWAEGAGSTARSFTLLLAVTGLVYLSTKALSFIRLLLSLFVIPGKPVRPTSPLPGKSPCADRTVLPLDIFVWSAPVMGTRHRRLGRHWQRIRTPTRAGPLLGPPGLPNSVQTGRTCATDSFPLPIRFHSNLCH